MRRKGSTTWTLLVDSCAFIDSSLVEEIPPYKLTAVVCAHALLSRLGRQRIEWTMGLETAVRHQSIEAYSKRNYSCGAYGVASVLMDC